MFATAIIAVQADVVTLHVPEAEDTVNMIGAAEIASMKQGACLINNARGTVVDLEALADALESGEFERERERECVCVCVCVNL